MTGYIEVPYLHWEGVAGRPLSPTAIVSTAQRKDRAEPATSRLVPYISTTSTPSSIAKDSLIKLTDLPKSDPRHRYDQICTDFVQYLDRCEQKGFIIKGYDTVKGKILNLPMSYDNRWGPVRRKELSEKLKRLEFWFEMQQDKPVTMITLTSYHEGLSIPQAWFELNKSRGKLLKLIAKYFNSPDYFWVPEPHKSGYVHYHLVVFAEVDNYTRDTSKHVGWVKCKTRQGENIWELMDGQGIEDKFRDLWEKKYKTGNHSYGLDFSKRKDDNKIQHLKNYLSKYLEKGFLLKEWSIGTFLFNVHLWDTGFRMYGASTAIRKMMNIQDEPDNHIVWLETRMQTTEITPEGEELEIDKLIWDRQYLPDWIDEPLWYGNGRQIPYDIDWTEQQRINRRKRGVRYYKWGRLTKDTYHGEYDGQPKTPEEWRAYRKQQQDGYL